MQTSQVLLLLVPTVLFCCVYARSLPDYNSHNRIKRQYADIKMGQRQAQLGLGQLMPHACKDFACGMITMEDIHGRLKRTGSDQRIAEIQALMALNNGGGKMGHGKFDTVSLGKRKRSDDYVDTEEYEDVRRLRLLQRVLDTLTGDNS